MSWGGCRYVVVVLEHTQYLAEQIAERAGREIDGEIESAREKDSGRRRERERARVCAEVEPIIVIC